MKNLEGYECEGQMDLFDYLDEIKLPDRCEDCVFLEDYKCGLKKDVKNCILDFPKKDGWHRIKYLENGRCQGDWPTCDNWQEVSTFHYDKRTEKYALTLAEGKDKTFKWAKENQVQGDVIAWRYKKGECF